jgi:quercetin dioxygenase-like cupin family protein
MRRLFLAAGLICVAGSALAQSSSMYPNPGAIKWGPPPAVFSPGAKFAVLAGDPTKAGSLYTIRLSMPSGYRIMPHYHPSDERITVLSGTFHVGMADTFDKSKTTAFTAGGFGLVPANMHHFGWASGRTVVQVSGIGPFQLIYLNPADMPKAH